MRHTRHRRQAVTSPRANARVRRTHPDVEFEVNWGEDGHGDRIDDLRRGQPTFNDFDRAASVAVGASVTRGEPVATSVLIYSRSGARWWGGDYAVEEYDADPDASASDRIVVRAESTGRIY